MVMLPIKCPLASKKSLEFVCDTLVGKLSGGAAKAGAGANPRAAMIMIDFIGMTPLDATSPTDASRQEFLQLRRHSSAGKGHRPVGATSNGCKPSSRNRRLVRRRPRRLSESPVLPA